MRNIFRRSIPESIQKEICEACYTQYPSEDTLKRIENFLTEHPMSLVDKIRCPRTNNLLSPMLHALDRRNDAMSLLLYRYGTDLLQNAIGIDVLSWSTRQKALVEITRSALAAGANPNIAWGSSLDYRSALGVAVSHGNIAAAKLLLENGALASDQCNEALKQWAITHYHSTVPGILVDSERHDEELKAQRAIDKEEMLLLLLRYGADLNKRTCFPAKKFSDPNCTPIEIALMYRNDLERELLLKHGATMIHTD